MTCIAPKITSLTDKNCKLFYVKFARYLALLFLLIDKKTFKSNIIIILYYKLHCTCFCI